MSHEMKKRTFNELLIAHTEPSPKRMTKSEMKRLGLTLLTKKQLDSMFADTCGSLTRTQYHNPFFKILKRKKKRQCGVCEKPITERLALIIGKSEIHWRCFRRKISGWRFKNLLRIYDANKMPWSK